VFVGRRGALKSIRTVFECARGRAKLGKDVGLHTCRHTFATRLVEAGVDLRTVQDLGGWASMRMLERYVHPTEERHRGAVNLLGSAPALEVPKETPNSTKRSARK
jgi:site-specific recombinase XerD